MDTLDNYYQLLVTAGLASTTASIEAIKIRDSYQCTYRITHISATIRDKEGSALELPLIVKSCDPGQRSGRHEVDFYQLAAPQMHSALLPACRYAAYSDDNQTFVLVFDDIQVTHQSGVSDPLMVPATESLTAIMETLVRVQSHWWNHPLLQSHQFRRRYFDKGIWADYFSKRHQSVAAFLTSPPPGLEETTIALYHTLLEALPEALTNRIASTCHLTLVHGDAHGGNFLVPKNAGHNAILIDWPNWRPGLPTDDLAYLIAAWPDAEQERALNELIPAHFESLYAHDSRLSGLYGSTTWESDLALSAGWTFLYTIGLMAEVSADWAVKVATNAAALCRMTESVKHAQHVTTE